jgi:uncharacterized protein (DUF1697 family)
MNVKMAQLKNCFEKAGFTDVRTLLASGNVVFSSVTSSPSSLERKIEAAMQKHLDRSFLTIVRPIATLRTLLASDPYTAFRLPKGSKRVVTLLRKKPGAKLQLPAELDGARILCVRGSEAFSAYIRGSRGPVFMRLIEKTFGEEITTRTWDTLAKVAA